ncbi:hypothetical protein CCP4SC76_2460001 [Gammaproteobacteria bacterium]
MIAGALRLSKLTGQNGSNIPEFLDSALNGAIVTAVAPKADKTYVDNQDATKASITYVDSQDATKADANHNHTYSTLNGLPTLGTAAAKDIPSSGNASATQVVYGTDTRLTDSRTPVSHTIGSHSDWPSSVSMTEVSYLDGLTSSIQSQLDSKASITGGISNAKLFFIKG